ncbi:MAG: hypothetical protein RRA92_09385 [Gemmatimonadota bacterium]|nr:hypothetical protein [Gemmatimonadota bacterium]
MISREDLESFLIRTEMDCEEIGENLWIVDPESGESSGSPPVAVSYSPPLVVLRSNMGAAPEEGEARLALFESLLRLNASDLVHGAYGLEGGEVILTDALEIENLDYSEFLASLESLALAVTSHRHELGLD